MGEGTKPKFPPGYTDYEEYTLPKSQEFLHTAILIGVCFLFLDWQSIDVFTEPILQFLIQAAIGVSSGLFLHESLHFIAFSLKGYDPVYSWPNRVYVPEVPLTRWDSIFALAAPQLLSILIGSFLFLGFDPSLEAVLGWIFVVSLGGGGLDLGWILLRLKWPKSTKILVDDDMVTYVAFPESTSGD